MRRRMGISSATTRNNTRKEDEDVVEDVVVVVFEIVLFFISYLAHSTQYRVFALLAYQLVGRSAKETWTTAQWHVTRCLPILGSFQL